MKLLLILLAFLLPSAALAQSQVALTSDVFVERSTTDANGKTIVVLEKPGIVTPGDKLVFVLSYKNNGSGPATDFVVTNPIPASVAFNGTDSGGALYSIDGGKSWGALGALKVREADGSSRAATLSDVTHVQWAFAQAIPAGNGGKLSFRGVVK